MFDDIYYKVIVAILLIPLAGLMMLAAYYLPDLLKRWKKKDPPS